MKASQLRVPYARINHFFSGTDMAHPHQRMFISALVGGREKYTARDITAVHARLRARGLNDIHFDAFLNHFRPR
jgi:hemoglobin